MALAVQRPTGTQDVVPGQSYKWHTVEELAKQTAQQYGFKEIRIPTFEQTGLFVRSVGETTDVVQKEMYSVTAGGDENYTLRPEGTAGVMRAIIENGILNDGFPQKAYYILSCFRHEKPQAGRLREFHQFGCEMVGTASPRADAEVIAMAKTLLDRIGLKNIQLNINSIGCAKCRKEYTKALKEYFEAKKGELCETCIDRLKKNPMRILDCKSPVCQEASRQAPIILDYLCDECKEHFDKLKKYLADMSIEYEINPRIVRGLDYYTKTVFEFISSDIGSQGTVCGGGRYDGLIEELGGASTPALGFAMGLERLILTMEKQGCEFMEEKTCDIYIASMGEAAWNKASQLVQKLREEGYFAQYDLIGRAIKPQMRYADKIGAKFVVVIGDNELEAGKGKLKNMSDGSQRDISLGDEFLQTFSDALINQMFEGLDEEMAQLLKDNGRL